nr:MAG TPA: hypothetical protein [Caudoviricetes sp.]
MEDTRTQILVSSYIKFLFIFKRRVINHEY